MDLNSITSVSWKPAAGDVIEGTYLGSKTRSNGFGDYPIHFLDAGEDRVVAIHAFHSVLRKGFDETKPQPGACLTVCYKGQQQNSDKTRTYHNYSVKVADSVTANTEPETDTPLF